MKHAIVIPGEAPETDDEEEDVRNRPLASGMSVCVGDKSKRMMPPRSSSEPNPSSPNRKVLKYNSLLHKKLRENQVSLGMHSVEFSNRQCQFVDKELHHIASGISTTQQTLQDASYKIRLVADTLYKVNDQLDMILSSQDLLPVLNTKK